MLNKFSLVMILNKISHTLPSDLITLMILTFLSGQYHVAVDTFIGAQWRADEFSLLSDHPAGPFNGILCEKGIYFIQPFFSN